MSKNLLVLLALTLLYAALLTACAATPTPILPVAAPSDTPSATPSMAPSPRPIADYPLALHDTWVYQSTRYEGFNTGQVMTATGTITETVVEINPAPDNYAAKIRRETTAETPVAGPPDLQKQLARPAETSEYWLLVAGNRIYRQEGKPDLAKLTDQDALEFQFPLNVGTRWVWFPAKLPNAPDPIGGVFRQVLKIGPIQVPAGRFDECFLIQDGWTTDTSTNWFCPGIGWIERKSDHNGTPYGSHWRLLRYQLSPQ